jgi:hypothetical protein
VALTVDLDDEALRQGVFIAAGIAVPAALIGLLFVDDATGASNDGWTVLFPLLVLAGLVLGAGCAAWVQRRGAPLTHGIATALIVFVGVQLIGIARRVISNESINWGRVASSLLLSLLAGTIGGLLGGWLAGRMPATRAGTDDTGTDDTDSDDRRRLD